jgi:hypothetical protein
MEASSSTLTKVVVLEKAMHRRFAPTRFQIGSAVLRAKIGLKFRFVMFGPVCRLGTEPHNCCDATTVRPKRGSTLIHMEDRIGERGRTFFCR